MRNAFVVARAAVVVAEVSVDRAARLGGEEAHHRPCAHLWVSDRVGGERPGIMRGDGKGK